MESYYPSPISRPTNYVLVVRAATFMWLSQKDRSGYGVLPMDLRPFIYATSILNLYSRRFHEFRFMVYGGSAH